MIQGQHEGREMRKSLQRRFGKRFAVKQDSRRSRGFTLMELLVVLAVIAILMGLAFPALQGARERARFTRARSEIMVLHQAWLAYRNAYGEFPASGATQMDAEMVAELGGGNPRGIMFMEFDNRTRLTGMLDPWRRPYVVDFDTESVELDPFVFQTRVTLVHGL